MKPIFHLLTDQQIDAEINHLAAVLDGHVARLEALLAEREGRGGAPNFTITPEALGYIQSYAEVRA